MTFDEWKRVDDPWKVVAAAKACTNAREAAVSRIIDTMLQLQLEYRHINPGYAPFSPTALAGESPGGGGMGDQGMIAALRYHPESPWHKACGFLLAQLPARQGAAMLLQAVRVRPEKQGSNDFQGTARQMVERQETLLMLLGLNVGLRRFESVEALQTAGRRARKRLWEWLEQGDIPNDI